MVYLSIYNIWLRPDKLESVILRIPLLDPIGSLVAKALFNQLKLIGLSAYDLITFGHTVTLRVP